MKKQQQDDLLYELSGGYDFEDDHYRDELEAAMQSSPEPVRTAARALWEHREEFNGWYASVADTPGGVTEEWQMNAVLGPATEREARVTGALRGLKTGQVDADTVLACMAACRQQYIRTMATPVPQR